MKITIFGSCRQREIQSYFPVTSIQERLTYPHYTKEIIQAIEYCKGISKFENNMTRYCFRRGILDQKELTYQKELQDEFESTDLFVLEIASRLCYEWNGLYVHHILTESQYGFHDISNITVRTLSDKEIEDDICTIQKLIYPKKLLILPHVYTRKTGKRYELVKLVEKVCNQHTIPFLDPSEQLNTENDIYEDDTAFHYTRKGDILVGKLYESYIRTLFNKKSIVFVLKQEYINYPNGVSFWGIGDMIRGLIGMYQLSTDYGFELISDITLHPISKFLKQDNHRYSSNVQNDANTIIFTLPEHVEHTIQNFLASDKEVMYIATNMNTNVYNRKITDDCRQFIKHILSPNDTFLSYYKTQTELIDNNYKVVHYRFGDKELFCLDNETNWLESYSIHLEKIHNENKSTILISDSKRFKDYVSSKSHPIKIFDTNICHSGCSIKETAIRDTLFDIFLMMNANKIMSFSRYSWISGFVHIIHAIYDIPLESTINFSI